MTVASKSQVSIASRPATADGVPRPARRPVREPMLRYNRSIKGAYVKWQGRQVYLGKARRSPSGQIEMLSAAGRQRYGEIKQEWARTTGLAPKQPEPLAPVRPGFSVVELAARYWEHAQRYYRKHGEPTPHIYKSRVAIHWLDESAGELAAAEFGRRDLKGIQQRLAEQGLSRTYIRDIVGEIRRVFRFGVEEELIEERIWQALCALSPLKAGRSEAREPRKVPPVGDPTVEATVAHLSSVVAAMVRFQRITGCRPTEVCLVRPCDVDRGGSVWVYRPQRYKSEHHGHAREIAIGPKAQEILTPFLLRAHDKHCFVPAEAEEERKARLRAARKTKVPPSQQSRRRAGAARGQVRYTKNTYARAVARACEKAFPCPDDLPTDAERKAWRKKHKWTPNQLRHAAATAVRQQFGLEAAQVVLGHAKADVTQRYAEKNAQLAAEVMMKIG